MAEKAFFEVFPQLQLKKEEEALFNRVQVRRVVMNKEHSVLKIYIDSSYLIQKRTIYNVEQAVKEQIFGGVELEVRIIEFYRLSAQYTPETLYGDYKDSIMLELKNYSALEYSMFSTAECSFDEKDVLQLTLDDTVVAHERETELKRILEKIFCERCGIPLEVRFLYRPGENERFQKQKESITRQEVADIMSRLRDSRERKEAEQASGNAGAADGKTPAAARSHVGSEGTAGSPAAAAKTQAGRFSDRGTKSFGGGRFSRKSDNPNVIYGRETDENITPIEQLDEEVGEVTIRGQIISIDEREIRGERTILMFDITDFTDTIRAKIFVKNEGLSLSGEI